MSKFLSLFALIDNKSLTLDSLFHLLSTAGVAQQFNANPRKLTQACSEIRQLIKGAVNEVLLTITYVMEGLTGLLINANQPILWPAVEVYGFENSLWNQDPQKFDPSWEKKRSRSVITNDKS